MNPVPVIDAIGCQIQRPRAQRVFQPPRLTLFKLDQFRFAFDHFRWWRPCGPIFAVGDQRLARPLKAIAPDGNAITGRLIAARDQIQVFVTWTDHHGSHRFVGFIIHRLTLKLRRDFLNRQRRDGKIGIRTRCIDAFYDFGCRGFGKTSLDQGRIRHTSRKRGRQGDHDRGF